MGIYRRTGLATWERIGALASGGGGTTPDPGGGGGTPTPGFQAVPLLSPGTALGAYSGTVPAGARYVHPDGSNSNPGTLAAPYQTVEYAISAVGGLTAPTIVLRGTPGGDFTNAIRHRIGRTESQLASGTALAITISKAGLTLMNAPGEAVMFDGTAVIPSGVWTQDVNTGFWWRSYTPMNWSPQFTDNTRAKNPTLYQQAIDSDDWSLIDGSDPDGNTANDIYWQFVDQQSVLGGAAARPERCWRTASGGLRIQLAQVHKIANLQPGRFFLDAKANRHWVADNPNTAVMEFTVQQKLFNFLGNDQAMAGIGVMGYAASQPLGGVVQAHRPRFRLEGNWWKDNAQTTFSYVGDPKGIAPYDSLQRANSWENSKNTHWRMTQCDRLVVEDEDFVNGNDGRFNPAPSAGHWKVTRAQDTMVRYCRHINQTSPTAPEIKGSGKAGWFDVAVKRPTVHSCEFWNIGQKDLTYEGTEDLTAFNNLSNNVGTEHVSYVDAGGQNPAIMNNVIVNAGAKRGAPETRVILTFYSNGPIHGVRDARRYNPPSYFLDPRYTTQQWQGGNGNEAVPPLEPMPMPASIQPVSMDIKNNITVAANARALFFDEDQVTASGQAQSFSSVGLDMDYNVWQLSPNLPAPTGNYQGSGQQIRNDTFNLDDLTTQGGKVVTTLAGMQALGYEAHGQLLAPSAASPVDATGNLTPAWQPQAGNAAPLPARLAALIGVPSGTTRLGRIPWDRSAQGDPLLARWRARVASATNANPAAIGVLGDSIAYGAFTDGSSNPKYVNSWVGRLRSKLAAVYGDAGTGIVICNGNANGFRANPAQDPRWSFAGTVNNTPWGYFQNGVFTTVDGTGNTVAFQPTQNVKAFRTHVISGVGGVQRVSIDGGTPVTLRNVSGAGTPDVAPLANRHPSHIVTEVQASNLSQHTLQVWGEGGDVNLYAMEARTYAGKFTVSILAISGKSLSGFSTSDESTGHYGLPLIDSARLDLLVCALIANDWQGSQTIANHKARLNTLIQRQRATGGDILLYVPPIPSPSLQPSGGPTWEQYRTATAEVGAAQGVKVQDDSFLLGTDWSAANQAGYYSGSTIHPNDAGAERMASAARSWLGI